MVKAFVKWLLTDGQEFAAEVNFAKLPDDAADQGAGPARQGHVLDHRHRS